MADQTHTHWRKIHKRKDPNMLYAEDLGPVGTRVRLEIVNSGVVMVKGLEGSREMPWLSFAGADGKERPKRFGLNPTNCKAMKALTGSPYIEDWRGGVISLVVVETEYRDTSTGRKELTDAIRIEPKWVRPPAQSRPDTSSSPPPIDPPIDPPADPEPLTDAEKRALEMADNEVPRG